MYAFTWEHEKHGSGSEYYEEEVDAVKTAIYTALDWLNIDHWDAETIREYNGHITNGDFDDAFEMLFEELGNQGRYMNLNYHEVKMSKEFHEVSELVLNDPDTTTITEESEV